MLQGGNMALMASDSQSVLGQAFLKYADALVLDDSNATYHFHVGRMLIVQGDCSSAVARLETALNWSDQHHLARLLAAFFLFQPVNILITFSFHSITQLPAHQKFSSFVHV